MRAQRSDWRQVGMCLQIVALICVGAAVRAQEPEFIRRAVKVETPQHFAGVYQWLNSTQFLTSLWQNEDGQKAGIYHYDLTTRTVTRLDALTEVFQRVGQPQDDPYSAGMAATLLEMGRVSPDGKWILWNEEDPGSFRIAQIDGTGAFAGTQPRFKALVPPEGAYIPTDGPCWTQDSRHWMVLKPQQNGQTLALIYDVSAPDKPEFTPMSSPTGAFRPWPDIWMKKPYGPVQYSSWDTRSTHSLVLGDHLYWCDWVANLSSQKEVSVIEVGIHRPARTLHSWRIKHPAQSVVQEMAISPTGDKIAWVLTTRAWPQSSPDLFTDLSAGVLSYFDIGDDSNPREIQPSHEEWVAEKRRLDAMKRLEKEDAKFFAEGPQTTSLWVSNLDGTQMRELGHAVIKSGTDWLPYTSDQTPIFLHWIPGGRLSFNYGRALWVLLFD